MGLLYAWATKEYLLWRMSIGQIIMYHNLGIELKYGKPKDDGEPESLANMTNEQKLQWREDMAQAQADKYGDTNG